MCLIVVREPNIALPFDKLSTACSVNPDGWGLIVNDRGKSEVIKQYSPKGNDPDAIAKLMDEAKDARVALHLRYATHGTKNLDNTHPFQTLNQQDHGIDLHLMHNGVLSDFGKYNDKHSDTHHFNETVLKRMMQDSLMHFGDEWIKDTYTMRVLEIIAGSGNKLVLFDNTGQVMIINRKAGKDFEGWWASNEYSFRSTHRSSTGYGSSYYGGEASHWERDEDGKWVDRSSEKTRSVYVPANGAKNLPAITGVTTSGKSTNEGTDTSSENNSTSVEILGETVDELDIAQVREAFELMKKEPETKIGFMSDYRQTFCELAEIDDLEELCRLTPSDILELVTDYPQLSAVLVMDLLYGLYVNDAKAAA